MSVAYLVFNSSAGWVGVLVIEMAPGVFLTRNPRRIVLDSTLFFSCVKRKGFGPCPCMKNGMTMSTPSHVHTYHCANAPTHGSAAFFFLVYTHGIPALGVYMMRYRPILSIGSQPRTGGIHDSAFQPHNSASVAFARAKKRYVTTKARRQASSSISYMPAVPFIHPSH